MQGETHNNVVNQQFDSKANAYLTSAVHAQGQDLELMAELVGQQPHAVALDMGCGGGHAAFRLATQVGKVVAYDLSASMLATVAGEAQKRGLANIVTKQGAAEDLPCPDASFDVAVTRYSAHHWYNVPAGVAQMHRAMKPGGVGIFMDVVSPGVPLLDTWLQAIELLRDPSHVRDLSVPEWQRVLHENGLEVERVENYRLHLGFASWVARMKTPQAHIDAIRSLQQNAASEVREYFAMQPDGSFTVDTALIVARKAK